VIAFGQPEVGSVMGSTSLRWIQLDSAGYERYDNEDFRAHVRRSGIVVTNSSSAYAQPCAEHTAGNDLWHGEADFQEPAQHR
jgi:phosphoglycerate dehydrogenase-like enzyme